jgi:hypothetical protein
MQVRGATMIYNNQRLEEILGQMRAANPITGGEIAGAVEVCMLA